VGASAVLQRIADLQPAKLRRLSAAAILLAVGLIPPALYAALPAMANRLEIDLVHAKTVPYRDNETYFLNPNKRGYDGARRFGEEALRTAPPSSVIFGDFTPLAVLVYLQRVEGVRRDLKFVTARGGERVRVEWVVDAGHRQPIYLTTWTPDYYDMTHLAGAYDLVPAGPLIEVRPREIP
jgi:hypothetical protein